jgi:hypothetical protein
MFLGRLLGCYTLFQRYMFCIYHITVLPAVLLLNNRLKLCAPLRLRFKNSAHIVRLCV